MTLTAGALSIVSVGSNSDSLLSAAATSGTAPYTYQWYRSTTTGFSPGGGNIISGATALTLNDTGLIPNTQYYYKVVVTDSAAATATSAQLAVLTTPQQLSQNQFQQVPIGGQVDLPFNTGTMSMIVDASVGSTLLFPGTPVKAVGNATPGQIPHVVPCTASSDPCIGFVEYDVKQPSFGAGARVNVSTNGNVMYLYATTQINAYAQVQLDITNNGVAAITSSSGAAVLGYAVDQALGLGSLIRVFLKTPTFTFA